MHVRLLIQIRTEWRKSEERLVRISDDSLTRQIYNKVSSGLKTYVNLEFIVMNYGVERFYRKVSGARLT